MSPIDLAVYAVVALVVALMTLLHSDPLTGRSLLDDLRESRKEDRGDR